MCVCFEYEENILHFSVGSGEGEILHTSLGKFKRRSVFAGTTQPQKSGLWVIYDETFEAESFSILWLPFCQKAGLCLCERSSDFQYFWSHPFDLLNI